MNLNRAGTGTTVLPDGIALAVLSTKLPFGVRPAQPTPFFAAMATVTVSTGAQS